MQSLWSWVGCIGMEISLVHEMGMCEYTKWEKNVKSVDEIGTDKMGLNPLNMIIDWLAIIGSFAHLRTRESKTQRKMPLSKI